VCGIIGVVLLYTGLLGKRLGTVIKGCLKNLEYRGYDSVGFALLTEDGALVLRKSKGMLDKVAWKLGFDRFDGVCGIGHTRWATHGRPSDTNAHPHTDCRSEIIVAHNGIISNYLEIKEDLVRKGHVFKSETDTEVIPHLLEELMSKGVKPLDALRETFKILNGAYAFVVILRSEPNKIYFARKISPLIIGLGNGYNFVASDIPAFLEYTNKVIVLRDLELGYVTPTEVYIEHLKEGAVDITKRVRVIDWTPEMARKSGYPHFMLKEIHEQPLALHSTLSSLVSLKGLKNVIDLLINARRVFITGAGTSFHAGLVGDFYLTKLAGIPTYPFISSECWKYKGVFDEGDVLIAISQSGETIDTLMAVRTAKSRGAKILAISNVVDSIIPRESDLVIYTRAGPEIGVAATKTFTTQVLTLLYLSLKISESIGRNSDYSRRVFDELAKVPLMAKEVIVSNEGRVRELSRKLMNKQSILCLGRGLGVPIAMEGALKIKEIAYIHAEAYPAGESKHGPIALIEEGFPVIFILLNDELKEKIMSNIEEMRSRGAYVITLAPGDIELPKRLVNYEIKLPATTPEVGAITYILPLQLLAYYISVNKGYDPDKPRNLAKTVTVE